METFLASQAVGDAMFERAQGTMSSALEACVSNGNTRIAKLLVTLSEF